MNNQEGMLAAMSALRGQGAGRLLGLSTPLPWAHSSPGHGPMGRRSLAEPHNWVPLGNLLQLSCSAQGWRCARGVADEDGDGQS